MEGKRGGGRKGEEEGKREREGGRGEGKRERGVKRISILISFSFSLQDQVVCSVRAVVPTICSLLLRNL